MKKNAYLHDFTMIRVSLPVYRQIRILAAKQDRRIVSLAEEVLKAGLKALKNESKNNKNKNRED